MTASIRLRPLFSNLELISHKLIDIFVIFLLELFAPNLTVKAAPLLLLLETLSEESLQRKYGLVLLGGDPLTPLAEYLRIERRHSAGAFGALQRIGHILITPVKLDIVHKETDVAHILVDDHGLEVAL